MYSIRKVLDELAVRTLTADTYHFREHLAKEILQRGVYGGVINDKELVLAVPTGEDIRYIGSSIGERPDFALGYIVNSVSFARVFNAEGARKWVHPDYEKQIRRNSEDHNMILLEQVSEDAVITMYGIAVEEDHYTVKQSPDFPSRAITQTCSHFNLRKTLYTNSDMFPVSQKKKEEIIQAIANLAIRTSNLVSHEDVGYCRIFEYKNQPYIAVRKKDTEDIKEIYSLVEDSDNKTRLLPLDHYGLTELTEAAKRSII